MAAEDPEVPCGPDVLRGAKAKVLPAAVVQEDRDSTQSPLLSPTKHGTVISNTDAGSVIYADLQSAGGLLKKRYIFAVMVFFGLASVYSMRINLSEAVEPMQDHFGWTNSQQGLVLSSFFWGYVVFQVPGGLLAARYGGKIVFGLGVLGTAILTFVLPFCAGHLGLLYALRALTGVCEAVTFPAVNHLYTQWVPCTERARVVGFTMAGTYFGAAVALPVSGALIGIHSDTSSGSGSGVSTTWPLVFYVFGVAGVAWFALWMWLVADSPEVHPTISDGERKYIRATSREDQDCVLGKVVVEKSERPPWRAFLTHPAALTLYLNHFASNYCVYTLMTYLPKYLDEELGYKIADAGFVASVPYVAQFLAATAGGQVADRLSRHLPLRWVRLIMELTGFIGAGGLLILTGYLSSHRDFAVLVVTGAIGFSGVVNGGGFGCNFIDISPHYAGQMYSISNTFGNVAGIIAPIIAGDLLGDAHAVLLAPGDDALTPAAPPASHWRQVFFVTAAIYAVAGLFWVFFMRAQPVPALN
eukprot:TRINITY_DN15715_c0_g1_i1.p1 TRINITY_DN15715_c0_g1~~TRINITY_DN15715_c0_g1_i1.p1  ORF type:complete len:555 (+),score=155.36 TRINITY_DN15715_c0_g1_i1:82-1665(+)